MQPSNFQNNIFLIMFPLLFKQNSKCFIPTKFESSPHFLNVWVGFKIQKDIWGFLIKKTTTIDKFVEIKSSSPIPVIKWNLTSATNQIGYYCNVSFHHNSFLQHILTKPLKISWLHRYIHIFITYIFISKWKILFYLFQKYVSTESWQIWSPVEKFRLRLANIFSLLLLQKQLFFFYFQRWRHRFDTQTKTLLMNENISLISKILF